LLICLGRARYRRREQDLGEYISCRQ
jgi:hypothetical protein